MAGQNVWIKCGEVRNMLGASGATTTTTGPWLYKDALYSSFQATCYGTGTVSATVVIDFSNDGITPNASTSLTITLSSGASPLGDGTTISAPWKYCRARVTAVTGTNAVVMAYMGA